MSTSEKNYGSKVYPHMFLIAPMDAMDIPVRDPTDSVRFPVFEIVDEKSGEVVGHHTIRSYIASFGNREIMTTADGTYGYVAMDMSDLRNEVKGVKLLAQAWGYVLGGDDFTNDNPRAFWVLTLSELQHWLNVNLHQNKGASDV